MLEMVMEKLIHMVVSLCEMMGLTIVAISTVRAFILYMKSLLMRKESDVKFQLANGLALSLEFKMAAEILKTVLIRDMAELVVLGAVIILRALLSFLIHFELKHDSIKRTEM